MAKQWNERRQRLSALERTVTEAAEFLSGVDEGLFDGNQTARQVLSHLVFWHGQYLSIAQSLAERCEPPLKQGTFAELNTAAAEAFQGESMLRLSRRLLSFQTALAAVLLRLPDWGVDFPVKYGSRRKTVAKRLVAIEAHIRNHLRRLQRAERLGQDWVRAYYNRPDGLEGGSS